MRWIVSTRISLSTPRTDKLAKNYQQNQNVQQKPAENQPPEETTEEVVTPVEGSEAQDPSTPVVEDSTTPTETVVEKVEEVVEKVEAEVKTTVIEAVEAVENSFADRINQIRETGSASVKALIHSFDTYFDILAPGKTVDGDRGARAQYAFWRALYVVIHNAPQSEFKQLWNIVLAYFNNHAEGIFHSRYVFRFSEHWSASEVELTAFQRLLNLIHLTADSQTRAVGLKQVDLDRTLGVFFTDEDRQRLISFYK